MAFFCFFVTFLLILCPLLLSSCWMDALVCWCVAVLLCRCVAVFLCCCVALFFQCVADMLFFFAVGSLLSLQLFIQSLYESVCGCRI